MENHSLATIDENVQGEQSQESSSHLSSNACDTLEHQNLLILNRLSKVNSDISKMNNKINKINKNIKKIKQYYILLSDINDNITKNRKKNLPIPCSAILNIICAVILYVLIMHCLKIAL